jgi:hypothetical protein
MSSFDANKAQPFQYEALSNPNVNIRILKLLSDGDDQPLRCTLEHTSLEKTFVSFEYMSLSYMWGTNEPTHPILINGMSFMIRANLRDFLLQARQGWSILGDGRTNGSSFLAPHRGLIPRYGQAWWIDAVCIDQQNEEENAKQIMIMGKIYKSGIEVISWLGKDGDDGRTREALEFMTRYGRGHDLGTWKKRCHDAMTAVASHQYWPRMCMYRQATGTILSSFLITVSHSYCTT